jgi:hypothetical protein
VAKKHRMRTRSRRAVEAARRASAPRTPTFEREPARAAPARPTRYGARTGTARAVGTPSAGLERAAASERAYVARDFRRIGIVMAITLALLAVSGIVLNVVER